MTLPSDRNITAFCRHDAFRPTPLLRHFLLIVSWPPLLLFGAAGCTGPSLTVSDLQYVIDPVETEHRKDHYTAIEYPLIDNETSPVVTSAIEPRSLARRQEDQVRDFSLQDAIFTALSQNRVIESSALGGIGAARVLTAPQSVPSVYDSAIQETGVLFGRRGLEAALSDFDTRWGTQVNLNSGDTAGFNTGLQKSLASGGSVSLFHNWNYAAGSNADYMGQLGAELRQPLLAGAGTEFTRVAGPVRPGFGAIAGVSQGVVIARINQDITLADFELSVRDALRDIENAYWDLYLAYRVYDATASAHNSAHRTAEVLYHGEELGKTNPADRHQAQDRFYQTRAQLELALNDLYSAEAALRRLIGMPINDGEVLRPSTEPVLERLNPDWETAANEGLAHRVELRRQKWQIHSLKLQLDAARSLVRPQLDAVGSYAVLGNGNQLLSQSSDSVYGSMSRDNLDSWSMGLEMSLPIGLRQSRSQSRNYELQLAKANAILAAQEQSVAHDIASSIQDLAAAWAASQSNLRRIRAAENHLRVRTAQLNAGTITSDLVLRGQASLADAEVAYYQQLVSYNKAITNFHLATGNLLTINGVKLAEGDWDSGALSGASMRAEARAHGIDNPNLYSAPEVFSSPENPFRKDRMTPQMLNEPQTEPAELLEQVPVPPDAPAPAEVLGSSEE